MTTFDVDAALEALLEESERRGAREIFLVPGEPPVMREAAGLVRLDEAPWGERQVEAVATRIAGSAALNIGEGLGELTRWYEVPGVVSARCTVARATGRLTVHLKRVPVSIPLPSATGVPQAIVDAVMSGYGLVIFAGLSGSGKTTSALSVVEHVNVSRPCHICTIEDPIEVRLEAKRALIQQRQVGLDAPSFAAGLRACMRQDPDLIFVGGLRDAEELQACAAAASAGHIVLLQLTAGSATDALRRMGDSFPPELRDVGRQALALALRAISVQRLLPRVGGGLVAAHEVLLVDGEMRDAIASGVSVLERRAPLPEGCQTMAQALDALHAQGLISEETRLRASATRQGRLAP